MKSCCRLAGALVLFVSLALGHAGCMSSGSMERGFELDSFMTGPIPASEGASLRGVSAPGEGVVWVSGSSGVVMRSLDGGLTFARVDPEAGSALDFRMLVAFDSMHAWTASAGPGANSKLFETTDGGESWSLRLVNREPEGFWDGLAFWDRNHGLLVGDAVAGYLSVLSTNDGGVTWKRVRKERLPSSPVLALESTEGSVLRLVDEVCFAASNRSLDLGRGGRAWLGTGGAVARVWHSEDWGATWHASGTPIRAGDPAAGVFAVAFGDTESGVAVGGKYDAPRESVATAAWTIDGGLTWQSAEGLPGGYRSGVAAVKGIGLDGQPEFRGWLAVGTSGASFTGSDGREWTDIVAMAMNALAVEPGGNRAYIVGPMSRFSVVHLKSSVR